MLLNCNHIFVFFIIITYLKYTSQTLFDDNEDDEPIELPDKVNDGHYLVKEESHITNKDEDADLSNELYETVEDKPTEKVENSDETKEGKLGKLAYKFSESNAEQKAGKLLYKI